MRRKTVFITGAGTGLGKEACIAIARRGHRVIAAVHYQNEINPLKDIAIKEDLDLIVIKMDLLIESERLDILDYDIDVLICNAAIGDSGSVADVSIDRIRNVFETNLFCSLDVVQLALRNMIEVKHTGRIVFISSLAGRIPMKFLSPYCASKAAIEVFTSCLRQEVKLIPNCSIEVCCIEPGAYATGFNKENNEKKYSWMENNSYFSSVVELIRQKELKVWNFLEQKPFDSIIKKYVHAVEDTHLKHRYCAPWWQALFVQISLFF